MTDIICYNPSIMKLMCEDTKVNNIYGLFTLVLYHILAFSVVAFTYIHILITCVTNKQSDAKNKALQTCGTHLVVFLFLEFNTLFPLVAHRSESVPAYIRRMFSITVFVFPPLVNPLVYGFKTKEIRQKILTCFKSKIHSVWRCLFKAKWHNKPYLYLLLLLWLLCYFTIYYIIYSIWYYLT